MHADRDDAPFPQRATHQRSLPLLTITMLGCLASAAMLYLPERMTTWPPVPATSQAPEPPTTPPSLPAPPREVARAAEPRPTAPAAVPQIHAYRPAPPPAEPAPRQTVFNDHNYQPREVVNRLPPLAVSSVAHETSVAKPHIRAAKWSWKTRDGRVGGTFQWRERNGRIDYASVCMNESSGSLRYRDCRKGAKQAFAKLCRKRRDAAACHAQNNYSALR